MLVVFTTIADQTAGFRLAKDLVHKKLAACVHVLPIMTSFYFWEGEVKRDDEHLLLIKTPPEKYPELESFINDNHSYDTPEIIAIDSKEVSDKYREWLEMYLKR